MAKHDKVESLKFYIHYLYYDLKSSEFDNKQLTKTIQKSLFQTNEQLHVFEKIISGLIHDKDLHKALKSVEQLYVPKRKKIQLNSAAIKEVHQKHAGTVDLLNEYLQDEFEDQLTTIKSEQSSDDEVKIEIVQKSIDTPKVDVPEIYSGLNLVQVELLDLFAKNSLVLSLSQLEGFAKAKSAFKNQLIDSINEHYYDQLDDVLIEEDEDNYTINENYYKRISVQ